MTGTVNNGRWAAVSFGDYTGQAPVVDDGKTIEVAFFADYRPMRRVDAGTIDGSPYRVVSVQKGDVSRGLKGMVVVTVEPPAEPEQA